MLPQRAPALKDFGTGGAGVARVVHVLSLYVFDDVRLFALIAALQAHPGVDVARLAHLGQDLVLQDGRHVDQIYKHDTFWGQQKIFPKIMRGRPGN